MATLNPKLLSPQLAAVLNSTAEIVKSNNKNVLYPEAVVLALIRNKETRAWQLLDSFHKKPGQNMDQLERSIQRAVETRRDVDGDLSFLTDSNERIPLGKQMIIALDEALRVAQAKNEKQIDTDHILATLASNKFSTGTLLYQVGLFVREVIFPQTALPGESPKTVVLSIEHIVKSPDVSEGKPRITGKTTTIEDVARLHNQNWSIEAIVAFFQLTPGQVFAALSYYHDHKHAFDQALGTKNTSQELN